MSFAADMKDFVSAAQAGQKMAGAKDDREYKRALTAQSQASTESINQKNEDTVGQDLDRQGKQAAINQRNASANFLRERSRSSQAARAALAVGPPSDVPATPYQPPAAGFAPPPPSPYQAVPVAPAAPAPVDPAVAPQYSSGGSVKKYAAGGAVTPDDDEEPIDPQPGAVDGDATTSGPTVMQLAAADDPSPDAMTDVSSRNRGFSPAAALDGVKAGLTYGSQALGLHTPAGVTTPGRQRATRAWTSGAHAAHPAELQQIEDWVDPDHKMPESVRGLAGIGAVYQFKEKQGDSEGAARMAFQMIQAKRQASQLYAVMAAKAAQGGDVDTAIHAAMKSYANVPDDMDVKLIKTNDGNIAYTYVDNATGKTMQQGVMTPDQLGARAMGFAEKGFDESLMAAFQRRPVQQPAVAVDKPMKEGDKSKLLKGVDTAYKTQNPDVVDPNDADKTSPKYTPEDQTLHKGAAYRIAASPKNDVTPEEATQIATKIADPTLTGAKNGFKPKPVDGGYEVAFGSRKTFVPQADFDNLMARRSELLAAQSTKDKKAADAGKGGVTASGIYDGVKSAAGAAADWVKNDLGKAAKEYPEAAARLKSAGTAVGRAASDAKDYIQREAAKPNIFKAIENGPGDKTL